MVVLVLVGAGLAPKTYNVRRSTIINTSPQSAFDQINSFKKWENWSPWPSQDSTIHNTYTGPEAGVGCKTIWTSKKSGGGSMEIMESNPPRSISTRVTIAPFIPFMNFAPFTGYFTFAKVENGTQVTWADSGGMNWPLNILTPMFEKQMGDDFEKGLANLKNYMENNPEWKLGDFTVADQQPQPILAVLDSCPASDIGKTLGSLYGEIGAVMKKNKLDFAGAPMAYYYSFSADKVVLEPAIPVAKQIKGEGRVKGRTTPAGKAVTVSFFGDYALMSKAMPAIQQYMKANNLTQAGPECDVYVTDPGTVKDKIQVETKMIFPVK